MTRATAGRTKTKIKKKKKRSKDVEPLTREEEDALLPDMETKIVKLKWLKRWKRNPRENDGAVPKLAKLIKEHGFRVPIICTHEGKIWAGDTRYLAAGLLGMTRVRVLITEFESTAKAMMFALAENKSSEWARWDPDLLSDAFGERTKMDISEMQKLSGFAPLEIRKLGGMEDDTAEDAGQSEEASSDGIEDEDGSWFRIVIVCKNDAEKEKLFHMLGIKGKKIVYSMDDIEVRATRKKIGKRKIG